MFEGETEGRRRPTGWGRDNIWKEGQQVEGRAIGLKEGQQVGGKAAIWGQGGKLGEGQLV